MIKVEHLDITFGSGSCRVHAVRDVSFDVAEGQSFGLVGESGSGKSTVAVAIARRVNALFRDADPDAGLVTAADPDAEA